MLLTSIVIQQFCHDNLENTVTVRDVLYADCPMCQKSSKHWNINLLTGVFHCYRCGWSGSFHYLGRYLKGNSFNLKTVMAEYESEITFEMLQAIYSKELQPLEIPDWTENTKELTGKSLLVRRALKYLKSRGISQELALKLQMRLGLEGKYKDCVLIPILEDGEVKNFVARRVRGTGKRYTGPRAGDGYAKKSSLIWGLDEIRGNDYFLIVVEGIFDAISLQQQGYPVVALLGKQISTVQIRKLADLAKWDVTSVIVLLDGACLGDAVKIAHNLEGFIPDVRIAEMAGEDDPAENIEEAIRAIEDARSIDCY